MIYDRPVPPPEGYMDKPVDEEELVCNLRRILELEKNAAEVAETGATHRRVRADGSRGDASRMR